MRVDAWLVSRACAHPVLNRRYVCRSFGAEGAPSALEEQNRPAKNSGEVVLLRVEDEMSELDAAVAQLRYICQAMTFLQNKKAPLDARRAQVRKLQTLGLMSLVFGPHAQQILQKVIGSPKLAAFVEQTCSSKLDSLNLSLQNQFKQNWQ